MIGDPIRFQSLEFALFFGVVWALYALLPRGRPRRLLLLGASWYFYARWNAWFLLILIALSATDYGFGRAIEGASESLRRRLLVCGISANLLFLGTFKYADFISANVAGALGFPYDPWTLHLLVPVGISFHTFQSISYLVDVSRKKTPAVRDFWDYALYIAFFPQLLAGPIVRAATFFGELYAESAPRAEPIMRGLGEMALGLLQKGAIADRFAPIADGYFAAPTAHPGAPAAWSGLIAFALQIYFDFAGYSNIAIGAARVLGFDFPENFHRPYLAWSITEFWRRWHISLSSWLRDYLYFPLGGNRHGRLLTARNLMITLLLGGLWHGASWTFVAWGGYHGVLLSLERAGRIGRDRGAAPPQGWDRVASTAATFLLVLWGWALFRAQTFDDALTILRSMAFGGPGPALLDGGLVALALLALVLEIAAEMGRLRFPGPGTFARLALTFGALVALQLAVYPGEAAPFIYFHF